MITIIADLMEKIAIDIRRVINTYAAWDIAMSTEPWIPDALARMSRSSRDPLDSIVRSAGSVKTASEEDIEFNTSLESLEGVSIATRMLATIDAASHSEAIYPATMPPADATAMGTR
jgi:hypothetical protein